RRRQPDAVLRRVEAHRRQPRRQQQRRVQLVPRRHGAATTAGVDPRNAPPFDTSTPGNSATTFRGVGAHQKHLVPGTTPWRAAIACGECHLVPASVSSVGHIDSPLPAEVIFAGTGAGSTWNGASCSSYCHGATLGAGGTATNPLWTKVDGTQTTCTGCHGDPP